MQNYYHHNISYHLQSHHIVTISFIVIRTFKIHNSPLVFTDQSTMDEKYLEKNFKKSNLNLLCASQILNSIYIVLGNINNLEMI